MKNDRGRLVCRSMGAARQFGVAAITWAMLLGSLRAQTGGASKADDAEDDGQAAAVSLTSTPADRTKEAWAILTEAAGDVKHPQTRIQALAALGLMKDARSEKVIVKAMADPDVDLRTSAALAAGQTKDRNMTTPLRNLLDDKEPQVVFTAATTLWTMNDRSGEDILVAVADGDRHSGPTLIHGAEQEASRDLHDPAMLAKMAALQAAPMLFGPLGYGIAAYNFIHKSGGDLSRATAIEDLAEERTEPIHKELIAALGDKDLVVRTAAAKALMTYHDKATSMAIYQLFADRKYPVRLTAAAAYLVSSGVAMGAPKTMPVATAKH